MVIFQKESGTSQTKIVKFGIEGEKRFPLKENRKYHLRTMKHFFMYFFHKLLFMYVWYYGPNVLLLRPLIHFDVYFEGLASCSALKELYLAGNKISEVEGLHRLLKLNVLDLRFNKISTTKCLGQLAANYNSLQAISLEGNPAQKNVGEEQLKKYLQGLLPHLVYLNRQSIKAKDATDRSTRLSIGSHQMDRGGRSELKSMRKASHGGAGHKSSTSSVHGRRSQPIAASKPARGRHGRLPPSGTTKTTSIRANFYDIGSKMPVSMTDISMRRSRSEGTLGVL